MSKQIYLKEWVKPMAELHALSVVEDEMGLTDQNSKEYQKAFEKAFVNFCEEFYTHSLIPMAANPTIRKGVNAYLAFDEELFEGRNSFIKRNFPNSEEARTNVKRLKTAVQSITEIFMSGKFSGRQFEYKKKDMSDSSTYENLDETNRKADIERFKRLFVTSFFLSIIHKFYQTDPHKMMLAIAQKIDGIPAKQFRDHDFNIQFALDVQKSVNSNFVMKDFLSGIE